MTPLGVSVSRQVPGFTIRVTGSTCSVERCPQKNRLDGSGLFVRPGAARLFCIACIDYLSRRFQLFDQACQGDSLALLTGQFQRIAALFQGGSTILALGLEHCQQALAVLTVVDSR